LDRCGVSDFSSAELLWGIKTSAHPKDSFHGVQKSSQTDSAFSRGPLASHEQSFFVVDLLLTLAVSRLIAPAVTAELAQHVLTRTRNSVHGRVGSMLGAARIKIIEPRLRAQQGRQGRDQIRFRYVAEIEPRPIGLVGAIEKRPDQ